ncbi:TolC family protein [Saccharicrinis sp. FJH62]|uniref:TolC family protein n=1 Tax=Saccharicrinis sp. FJH62 TaxID=3344657 RepID=UPI0035D4FAD1
MKMKFYISIAIIMCCVISVSAQEKEETVLSLDQVIELAQKQSLDAFIQENMYLSSWWEYKAFKAQQRPWLELNSNPLSYKNSIEAITDNTGSYLKRSEKLQSDGRLSLTQNIMTTGGDIYINSRLSRLEDYANNEIGYGYTPFSVGISQPLFQFNTFKWQKKIEPLKFEIAKKEYIKSAEDIAMKAITVFFNFLDAQMSYKIAELNKQSADTLYFKSMGLFERGAIASMDLKRLELNKLNTENEFERSKLQLERYKFDLKSYLRISENMDLRLLVPDSVPDLNINPDAALAKATENNPDVLDFKRRLIEANREIARAKGTNGIQSNLNVNFGWSKSGQNLNEVNHDFDSDRGVELSLYIPIVDWGMSRGRREIAESNKKVTAARVEIEQINFEHDVLMSAMEFNMQEALLVNARKANAISEKTYKTVEERFLSGKVNLETLYAARNERDNALRSVYNRIRQYWSYYYYMRSITLFDFQQKQSLSNDFDNRFGLQ